jgi:1-phosphatidylinositol phosphodiesterase
MATTPQNWMEEIDDNLLLSQITIPGTHDTCALYGGDLPICQTLSIIDQLKHGVRALDITCRHYQNTFPIHHDRFYQNIDFGDVQESCIYFLRAFPSETILMHIKEEYDNEGNTQTF